MSNVIHFDPTLVVPGRSYWLADQTMLFLLFEDEQRLRPFIKHLFEVHGIISVAQWDEAGGVHLLKRFRLDSALKKIFLSRIGIRHHKPRKNAEIIKLRSAVPN